MSQWSNKVRKEVRSQMQKKYVLSDEELAEIMPEVVEFYNENDDIKDVYRTEDGVAILLVKTPKKLTNDDGKIININKSTYKNYNNEEVFSILCQFIIRGKSRGIFVNATSKQWNTFNKNPKDLGGIFGLEFFIRGDLRTKYKKTSESKDVKALSLPAYLKKWNVKTLDEIKDETQELYNTTAYQVM